MISTLGLATGINSTQSGEKISVEPAILQANGEHLPHPRVSVFTTETEGIDLVAKLDGVCWINVASSKIPQVDSEFSFVNIPLKVYFSSF